MNQLRHFIKNDNVSKSDKEQELKWMKEDEAYTDTHCLSCNKAKTNPYADLCFSCAKKKALRFNHVLTQDEYNKG